MSEPNEANEVHGYSPEDSVEAEIDLYDSEVRAVQGVIDALNETRLTKATTVEGWRREIVQRFEDIGLKVSVRLMEVEEIEAGSTSAQVGQVFTQITIQGRLDGMKVGEFDHDRQAHEVRSNVLGADQADSSGPITIGMGGQRRTPSGLILP